MTGRAHPQFWRAEIAHVPNLEETDPGLTAWRLSAAEDCDAFDRYRESMAGLFGVRDVEGRHRDGFDHLVQGRTVGPALVTRSRSIPQTLFRDAGEIRRGGFDHVAIVLDLGPRTRGDYDGRSLDSRAGDLRLLDLARPLRAASEDLHLINLTVPRASLPATLLQNGWHGRAIARGSGAGRLLAGQLELLIAPTALSAAEAEAAVLGAFHLAAAGWSDAGPASREALAGLRPAVRHAAERRIAERLADPHLTPETIARALRVSRPTLYRAFTDEGGVWAFILGRRLDRAYAALMQRPYVRGAVGEAAYASGFASAAHFSRLFRRRFGESPAEVAAAGPAQVAGGAGAGLIDWVAQTAAPPRLAA